MNTRRSFHALAALVALALSLLAAAALPADGNASRLSLIGPHGYASAYAQVNFFCQGRYVHYRADTFVTDASGSVGEQDVRFRTALDTWNGRQWVYRGIVLDWQSAAIGGNYSLNLRRGLGYFRLRTQFAHNKQNGTWFYSGWLVETFNHNGLQYCSV
jgi:hypothetical protein